ncbi:unnamed protein product [Prunus armeniaca]
MARTCLLHSHMYITGTVREDFGIYVDVLEEFDFELAYMSMRYMDFKVRFDELMTNVTQSISSASDPSDEDGP